MVVVSLSLTSTRSPSGSNSVFLPLLRKTQLPRREYGIVDQIGRRVQQQQQQQQQRFYGQGSSGDKTITEERHIANAIRWVKERNPRVMITVENVTLSSGVAERFLPPIVRQRFASPDVASIKILTHADVLSDEALRYQIHQVQKQQRDHQHKHGKQEPMAIFALDLSKTDGYKQKHFNNLRYALLGACYAAGSSSPSSNQAFICGLPNAGKSSLIYPLTKERTLRVKKKQSYHLPKVSSQAGRTLGLKKHVMEFSQTIGKGPAVSLMDSPGLRPRLDGLNEDDLALLLAANIILPSKGYITPRIRLQAIKYAIMALNRHAQISQQTVPEYIEKLGLSGTTQLLDPLQDETAVDTFIDAICQDPSNPGKEFKRSASAVLRKLNNFEYGGAIFAPPDRNVNAHSNENMGDDIPRFQLDRGSPIVYMNDQAKRLVEIGKGDRSVSLPRAVPSSPPNNSEKGTKVEGKTKMSDRNLGKELANTNNKYKAEPNPSVNPEIMEYSMERATYNCMICAGFVKRNNDKRIYGCRKTFCMTWKDDDIRAFYSRMTDAFRGQRSRHVQYLMKDSFVCTIAGKHKLRSRAQAYKKIPVTTQTFPMPNEERPRRFQNDQPIPFRFACTRLLQKRSCCVDPNDKDNERHPFKFQEKMRKKKALNLRSKSTARKLLEYDFRRRKLAEKS